MVAADVEPEELLRRIRDVYVRAFARAARTEAQRSKSLQVEPCLGGDDDDAGPRAPSAEPFRVPMRQDLVPMDDGGELRSVMVVRGPAPPPFEPFAVEYDDGFQLGLGPFTWDACQVVAVGLPPAADYTPLVEWFAEWADLPEVRPIDPTTGLRHVVHDVSEPVVNGDVTVLEVDLGTAEVDALDELLGTLQAMGATVVILGEFPGKDAGTDDDGGGGNDYEVAGPTGAA